MSHIAFAILAPFGVIILGPISLIYFLLGLDKGDLSGDASLPHSVVVMGLCTGLLGSLIVGGFASLIGANPLVAYPSTFYGSVLVGYLWMAR